MKLRLFSTQVEAQVEDWVELGNKNPQGFYIKLVIFYVNSKILQVWWAPSSCPGRHSQQVWQHSTSQGSRTSSPRGSSLQDSRCSQCTLLLHGSSHSTCSLHTPSHPHTHWYCGCRWGSEQTTSSAAPSSWIQARLSSYLSNCFYLLILLVFLASLTS